ncbi:MAG: undecaprenyl/decaprenyl-phosphate alpha-N-acetylglucosaminyl 1-phosphate transferase, partial [Leptolyngbyaceae cyanobacterium SM2_5_2]|nr:undecaprenyl/decaprenyl-phosphate alpha-N-acetylglucosaminyl 1-phosphate transferase [Leptolyngbyaceae cyanobacterium SM2_5_2]
MPVLSLPITPSLFSLYKLAILGAFTLVLVTTPLVRKFALQFGRVDIPSARKVHVEPIARLGGIAICLGTVVALLLALLLGGSQALPAEAVSSLLIVLMGSLGFFAIGISDDVFMLPPLVRLGMQAAVAGLVWQAGVRVEFVTIPGLGLTHLGWLSLPVTVIWLAGVVNAINWIDGLDGLASGVGAIAAATSFLICLYTGQVASALVMVALLGSLLGFLVFNFNPAQIFMGDGGSYFIGFLLAGVGITGLVKTATATAVFLPLLVLAVPLLDMSAVILARLRQGQSPFLADKRHLHHRLLKVGLPHRLTVL